MSKDNPIVGHATIRLPDGTHVHQPLREDEARRIWDDVKAAKEKRAADMPTEVEALKQMGDAYQRLRELGWKETCYGPTGVVVQLIEPGSTGIHRGIRHAAWPEKTWWLGDEGWPSTPILFKPLP